MLKDVLIPLRTHPAPESEAVVSRLLQLASSFASHATLAPLEIEMPTSSPRWSTAFLGLTGAGADVERASQEASRTLQGYAGPIANLQVIARPLRVDLSNPGPSLSAAARCHDVTMVFYKETNDRALAEAVLFGTGRPTLLVPSAIPESSRPFAKIAIAWDGTGSATRALHDAMPLVVNADEVVILTAPGDKRVGEEELTRLSDYLVRQGVVPRRATADIEVLGIGLALQHYAKREGAGLLVMGAYGHSRMQQFILGGATRHVLDNLQLPVLMSQS